MPEAWAGPGGGATAATTPVGAMSVSVRPATVPSLQGPVRCLPQEIPPRQRRWTRCLPQPRWPRCRCCPH
eukprot:3520694-Lingulodinium_polyedra.AAC.1